MPDYEVTIKETETYIIKVYAHDWNEAQDKAWELLDEDKDKYHHDSEGESSCVEC